VPKASSGPTVPLDFPSSSASFALTASLNAASIDEGVFKFLAAICCCERMHCAFVFGAVLVVLALTSPTAADSFRDVQVVTVHGASGGTFTLSLAGVTTAPIAYNAQVKPTHSPHAPLLYPRPQVIHVHPQHCATHTQAILPTNLRSRVTHMHPQHSVTHTRCVV
jgi:hypothetical protein